MMKKPIIKEVNPTNIPALMKQSKCWINWTAGTIDSNGKFAKYPVDPLTGYKVNAHNKNNQITFSQALSNLNKNGISGIGYVLDGSPLIQCPDGTPLYLVGIDIDDKAELEISEIRYIWEKLGRPYIEVSPSNTGIRIFCLSRHIVSNKNKNGLEIYSSKRFLTLTGWSSKGRLIDSTVALDVLHQAWFDEPAKTGCLSHIEGQKNYNPPERTPRNIALTLAMLDYISPNCSYEMYRNVIWALESTGWPDIEDIQRNWSLGAPHRFTEDGLTIVKSSYDKRIGGISYGTLVHYARINGYKSKPVSHISNIRGQA